MPTDTLLADRVEIADLFARLAHLLDEKRWDDAATVHADDVAIYSPRGEIHGIDEAVGRLRRSEAAGEHTQHLTTDLLVDVDGDRAAVSANSIVHFYRDGQAPYLTNGLRLACVAVRTPAGWRLREYRITLAWSQRN
ncbi:nuclear transport factor 2 family protein [Actinomadura macrotermitis]|uniref:SnoaL-like domain-containing protein n=1 Tax=Actinomadura macrotermitis TaxID=2585200 RepID=A0A7K0C1T6_9ACTN|nr:nuclear transport factor 2 family protein [Actinomadura macrotermitis]MQY07360.1 hypothetical protein [Actinomadura macrotermitis]